jgi:hypothetical protein
MSELYKTTNIIKAYVDNAEMNAEGWIIDGTDVLIPISNLSKGDKLSFLYDQEVTETNTAVFLSYNHNKSYKDISLSVEMEFTKLNYEYSQHFQLIFRAVKRSPQNYTIDEYYALGLINDTVYLSKVSFHDEGDNSFAYHALHNLNQDPLGLTKMFRTLTDEEKKQLFITNGNDTVEYNTKYQIRGSIIGNIVKFEIRTAPEILMTDTSIPWVTLIENISIDQTKETVVYKNYALDSSITVTDPLKKIDEKGMFGFAVPRSNVKIYRFEATPLDENKDVNFYNDVEYSKQVYPNFNMKYKDDVTVRLNNTDSKNTQAYKTIELLHQNPDEIYLERSKYGKLAGDNIVHLQVNKNEQENGVDFTDKFIDVKIGIAGLDGIAVQSYLKEDEITWIGKNEKYVVLESGNKSGEFVIPTDILAEVRNYPNASIDDIMMELPSTFLYENTPSFYENTVGLVNENKSLMITFDDIMRKYEGSKFYMKCIHRLEENRFFEMGYVKRNSYQYDIHNDFLKVAPSYDGIWKFNLGEWINQFVSDVYSFTGIGDKVIPDSNYGYFMAGADINLIKEVDTALVSSPNYYQMFQASITGSAMPIDSVIPDINEVMPTLGTMMQKYNKQAYEIQMIMNCLLWLSQDRFGSDPFVVNGTVEIENNYGFRDLILSACEVSNNFSSMYLRYFGTYEETSNTWEYFYTPATKADNQNISNWNKALVPSLYFKTHGNMSAKQVRIYKTEEDRTLKQNAIGYIASGATGNKAITQLGGSGLGGFINILSVSGEWSITDNAHATNNHLITGWDYLLYPKLYLSNFGPDSGGIKVYKSASARTADKSGATPAGRWFGFDYLSVGTETVHPYILPTVAGTVGIVSVSAANYTYTNTGSSRTSAHDGITGWNKLTTPKIYFADIGTKRLAFSSAVLRDTPDITGALFSFGTGTGTKALTGLFGSFGGTIGISAASTSSWNYSSTATTGGINDSLDTVIGWDRTLNNTLYFRTQPYYSIDKVYAYSTGYNAVTETNPLFSFPAVAGTQTITNISGSYSGTVSLSGSFSSAWTYSLAGTISDYSDMGGWNRVTNGTLYLECDTAVIYGYTASSDRTSHVNHKFSIPAISGWQTVTALSGSGFTGRVYCATAPANGATWEDSAVDYNGTSWTASVISFVGPKWEIAPSLADTSMWEIETDGGEWEISTLNQAKGYLTNLGVMYTAQEKYQEKYRDFRDAWVTSAETFRVIPKSDRKYFTSLKPAQYSVDMDTGIVKLDTSLLVGTKEVAMRYYYDNVFTVTENYKETDTFYKVPDGVKELYVSTDSIVKPTDLVGNITENVTVVQNDKYYYVIVPNRYIKNDVQIYADVTVMTPYPELSEGIKRKAKVKLTKLEDLLDFDWYNRKIDYIFDPSSSDNSENRPNDNIDFNMEVSVSGGRIYLFNTATGMVDLSASAYYPVPISGHPAYPDPLTYDDLYDYLNTYMPSVTVGQWVQDEISRVGFWTAMRSDFLWNYAMKDSYIDKGLDVPEWLNFEDTPMGNYYKEIIKNISKIKIVNKTEERTWDTDQTNLNNWFDGFYTGTRGAISGYSISTETITPWGTEKSRKQILDQIKNTLKDDNGDLKFSEYTLYFVDISSLIQEKEYSGFDYNLVDYQTYPAYVPQEYIQNQHVDPYLYAPTTAYQYVASSGAEISGQVETNFTFLSRDKEFDTVERNIFTDYKNVQFVVDGIFRDLRKNVDMFWGFDNAIMFNEKLQVGTKVNSEYEYVLNISGNPASTPKSVLSIVNLGTATGEESEMFPNPNGYYQNGTTYTRPNRVWLDNTYSTDYFIQTVEINDRQVEKVVVNDLKLKGTPDIALTYRDDDLVERNVVNKFIDNFDNRRDMRWSTLTNSKYGYAKIFNDYGSFIVDTKNSEWVFRKTSMTKSGSDYAVTLGGTSKTKDLIKGISLGQPQEDVMETISIKRRNNFQLSVDVYFDTDIQQSLMKAQVIFKGGYKLINGSHYLSDYYGIVFNMGNNNLSLVQYYYDDTELRHKSVILASTDDVSTMVSRGQTYTLRVRVIGTECKIYFGERNQPINFIVGIDLLKGQDTSSLTNLVEGVVQGLNVTYGTPVAYNEKGDVMGISSLTDKVYFSNVNLDIYEPGNIKFGDCFVTNSWDADILHLITAYKLTDTTVKNIGKTSNGITLLQIGDKMFARRVDGGFIKHANDVIAFVVEDLKYFVLEKLADVQMLSVYTGMFELSDGISTKETNSVLPMMLKKEGLTINNIELTNNKVFITYGTK